MLNWAKQFNIFCYLDNQQYPQNDGYECLLAVNAVRYFDDTSPFSQIDSFLASNNWYFGHLSYDLKNELHQLTSKKETIEFPHYFFFQPEVLLVIKQHQLQIQASDPDAIQQEILATKISQAFIEPVDLRQRLSKEEYVAIIKKLQEHILKGDCYEINFCQEFFAEDVKLDPVDLFQRLMETSPVPFSTLYRLHERYLVCASPERFLKKIGNRIFSQPMKGTAKRTPGDKENDDQLRQELYEDPKEKAENVMVVDLVRNDLSRVCEKASVEVEELFGVYTFPQVHQMVSTVSGKLRKDVSFSEIIAATFPMGSMTGAPKLRVMQLIDAYEPVGRGLFSGSIGYINPAKDFDFNVIIRSVFYNRLKRYLSYYTGSGITFYSSPEKEWEECLLKGTAIKKVLGGEHNTFS